MIFEALQKWVDAIRPLFPHNASFETDRRGDFIVRIHWESGCEWVVSPLVRIIIVEETIDRCRDFDLAGEAFQQDIENRITRLNDTYGWAWPHPVEEWRITPKIIR